MGIIHKWNMWDWLNKSKLHLLSISFSLFSSCVWEQDVKIYGMTLPGFCEGGCVSCQKAWTQVW